METDMAGGAIMKLCITIRQNAQGGFIAACTSLPGCVSAGKTEQQARESLQEAIRGYLASVSNFVPEQIQEVLEYQT
jgi:predicted RNase H-like HicB family nuclease